MISPAIHLNRLSYGTSIQWDKILSGCLKHQYGHEFWCLSHLYCVQSPDSPPALCWWARTIVESNMAYSLSLSCDSTSKTLCHTPVLAQRIKRVCITLKAPKRSGKSRHGIPERYRYNTAWTKSRLSLAVTPTVPIRPGNRSLICSHWSSLNA